MYRFTADTHHGRLYQCLQIVQFHYTIEGCVCCPREGLGASLAESPKVLKPKEKKNQAVFYNRFIGMSRIGLV